MPPFLGKKTVRKFQEEVECKKNVFLKKCFFKKTGTKMCSQTKKLSVFLFCLGKWMNMMNECLDCDLEVISKYGAMEAINECMNEGRVS